MIEYKINYTSIGVADYYSPEVGFWSWAETAELKYLRPESSSHFPGVKAKVLYNDNGIAGIFYVEDRFVICRNDKIMGPIWQDSCVEFFFKPDAGKGYFNFEFNCAGVLYASYIVNHERTKEGFKEFTPFTEDDCRMVKTFPSEKGLIKNEIKGKLNWSLQFFIPFELIEKYAGAFKIEENSCWTGNFNKCADNSSHPHWITWSPVKNLNFHEPESFGKIIFGRKD